MRVNSLDGGYDLEGLSYTFASLTGDNPLTVFDGNNVGFSDDNFVLSTSNQTSSAWEQSNATFSSNETIWGNSIQLGDGNDALNFSESGYNKSNDYYVSSPWSNYDGGSSESVTVKVLSESSTTPISVAGPSGDKIDYLPPAPDNFKFMVDVTKVNSVWSGYDNNNGSSGYHAETTVNEHEYGVEAGPNGVVAFDVTSALHSVNNVMHYADGFAVANYSQSSELHQHLAGYGDLHI